MDTRKWLDKALGPRGKRTERMEMILRVFGFTHTNYIHLRLLGPKARQLTDEEIEACAEIIGVPSPLKKSNLPALLPSPSSLNGMVDYPVCGVVEAGAFREVDTLAQVDRPPISWERDKTYPNAAPMAWEVRGDSMDRTAAVDGATAIGVDFADTGLSLRNDMVVVVEQVRGGLIERTIKRAAVFNDRIEFRPYSHNPNHRPIIYITTDRRDAGITRLMRVP